ncbi:helix-turn-helix domain-containing protein [Tolypothrix sp. PCC 7910]|uniref:helix-turn-helix domain-containing protein n=1 Tax=Tolypothrix sp. PCC 7910 TaxID=2099387 RepID=UPI0014277801|nr:helix-turn-helix domain-containing protein [Tolypothrix sp. PCC 7910]QIR39656.1 helix-turn-helix domain-containing protein [Tolypothrix sp. PCC 7910]
MSSYLSELYEFDNYDKAESKFLTAFQRKVLLKNLQIDLPSEYRRRIEIMLLADRGKTQIQICQLLGCSQHMARYWIGMAKSGLAHKWHEQPIGRPRSANEAYLERLKELVNHSPRDYGYSFHCWTALWLSKHLANEFGVEISDRHINRLLKQMGLSTKQRNNNRQAVANHIKDSAITIDDLQLPCEPSLQWSLNLSSNNN